MSGVAHRSRQPRQKSNESQYQEKPPAAEERAPEVNWLHAPPLSSLPDASFDEPAEGALARTVRLLSCNALQLRI